MHYPTFLESDANFRRTVRQSERSSLTLLSDVARSSSDFSEREFFFLKASSLASTWTKQIKKISEDKSKKKREAHHSSIQYFALRLT